MLKKYYLLLLIILFGHSLAMAEKIQYDLFWKNSVIGVVTAEKSVSGELIYYSIKTEVTVNVGFKQNIDYLLENAFKADTLQSALMTQYRNDNLNQSSSTSKKANSYEFKKENKVKTINRSKIGFTVAMLYFTEPLKAKYIYSESWGEYLAIKATESHTYQLTQPNGKINTYTYKNGICHSVTLNNTFYTITLKLKQ